MHQLDVLREAGVSVGSALLHVYYACGASHWSVLSRLNLASFVTTWMEPECEALMTESYNINYIDESEYPSTTSIQNRCDP